MHVLPSAALISREAFESVGGFDERLSGYEDDDLFLRLFCRHWDNVYLPESLLCLRQVKTSAGHSPRMAKSRMVYARMLMQRFPDDHFLEWPPLTSAVIAPRFYQRSAYLFHRALAAGDAPTAAERLADMAELAPHLGRKVRLKVALMQLVMRSVFGPRVIRTARRLPGARLLFA
jgi:hypothetical protein